MSIINYISSIAVPITIFLITIYGFLEKKNVFDIFLNGAREGIGVAIKIFPTLVGLFISINLLRSSGIIDAIINLLTPILNILKFPKEIMPIALLRPISGSASLAVAVDIMKTYGVDSIIGLITSTIMGSTETTLYTIAVYTGAVGIKKTRFVLAAALIADIVGMLIAVVICNILS